MPGFFRAFVAASFLILCALPAYVRAGAASPGTLAAPHFLYDGVVIVYTSGNRTNVPSCAAGQPGRFAFDSTTPGGKSQLAGILAAFSMGKQVTLVGLGTCLVFGDSETLNYFIVHD